MKTTIFALGLAALTAASGAAEWTPLDPPARWDVRLQQPDAAFTPNGEPKPAPRPDGLSVAFVLDPASVSAEGTSALLRPRRGFGLPPHALRVDPSGAMVLGLAPASEAGYATDAMVPGAPLTVGRASDDSFRFEWTEPAGPLRLVASANERQPIAITPRIQAAKERGVPLCFLSPGDKWLFVNHLTLSDDGGTPVRTADLLVRSGGGYAPLGKEPFAEIAWRHFCSQAQVSEAEARGRGARGLFHQSWSVTLHNTVQFWMVAAPDSTGQCPLGLMSYDLGRREFADCHFTTVAAASMREPWRHGSPLPTPKPLPSELKMPTFSDRMPDGSGIERFHRPEMEANLGRALKLLPPDRADKLAAEQREWAAMLDTAGYVESLRSWSLFPDPALGQCYAIIDRGNELEAMVKAARAAAPASAGKFIDPSPDGRWALRVRFDEIHPDQQGAPISAEVVEKATGRVVVTLMEDDDEFRREPSLLWRTDSTAFAYHASNRRMDTMSIHLLVGGEFIQFPVPSTEEKAPRAREGERFFHFERQSLEPKRWLKNGDLQLAGTHALSAETKGVAEDLTVTLHYELTVGFDHAERETVVKEESSHETREP